MSIKTAYYTAALLLLLTVKNFAQISPGDLSKVHAGLEGLSNCTKCHVIGEQVQSSKCLGCHKEIKQMQDEGRGYHSSGEVKGKNCWSCHSEHHGRNFRIINFNKDKFDHNGKTKFQLNGKHAELSCTDCHQQKFITGSGLKNRKNTYLGLSINCASCHEDYHKNTLGNNCSGCHNTTAFRPAPGFDHNKINFKLTGSHQNVKCSGCHPVENKNGKEFQRFAGINFSSCENCHKDVHQGKFGKDCKSCHSTTSFKQINKGAFDHNKTNFPLVGKHKAVSCSSCHKAEFTKKIPHEKCIDCHSDYHKGAFKENAAVKDCSKCHTVEGFTPSNYTIEEHNKTKFPLTGSHLAVPCKNCHYKDESWHFNDMNVQCIDCHKNVHGKEISAEVMPDNNCMECHQTESWHTIKFDHNKTGFKLLGKHSTTSCGNCHYVKGGGGKQEYKFASLSGRCEECHKDIHSGQFRENGVSDCSRCHFPENWSPVSFDHNKTQFPLVGAHQKVECSSCHKKLNVNGAVFINYKIKDFKCAACHS